MADSLARAYPHTIVERFPMDANDHETATKDLIARTTKALGSADLNERWKWAGPVEANPSGCVLKLVRTAMGEPYHVV